jgi:AcrR family transcriptional regulator
VSERKRSSSTGKRKLKLKARAERQRETRRRIVDAATGLHAEVGPLSTTITAIAERAGVERLTVYRHFPDEESLVRACTQHYFEAHPAPDPQSWLAVEDPEARVERGLTELYHWWAENAEVVASVLRDYQVAPERVGHGLVEYTAAAGQALLQGWSLRGRRRAELEATIALAVHFRTFEALSNEGMRDREAARLMARMVVCSHRRE